VTGSPVIRHYVPYSSFRGSGQQGPIRRNRSVAMIGWTAQSAIQTRAKCMPAVIYACTRTMSARERFVHARV